MVGEAPHDLGSFVSAEVTRAEAAYEGVRTRSLNTVGVAGALVALIAALIGLAAGSHKDILSSGARWTAAVALAAFVLSAICALIINVPARVVASNAAQLRQFTSDHWDDEGWDQSVATFLVEYLVSLREANAASSRWLIASIMLEVAGIALMAVTALVVMWGLPH